MHDLTELSRYTGLFTAGCLLSLVFCVYAFLTLVDSSRLTRSFGHIAISREAGIRAFADFGVRALGSFAFVVTLGGLQSNFSPGWHYDEPPPRTTRKSTRYPV
jgi:hypothetical protein